MTVLVGVWSHSMLTQQWVWLYDRNMTPPPPPLIASSFVSLPPSLSLTLLPHMIPWIPRSGAADQDAPGRDDRSAPPRPRSKAEAGLPGSVGAGRPWDAAVRHASDTDALHQHRGTI